MKKFIPALFFFVFVCIALTTVNGQVSCNSDTLYLATGINHSNNSVDTIGQPDANWTVLSGPLASSLSFPSPGWVIPQYQGWYYTQPGSQWISPFNFANYGVDNLDTPYIFRYTFCLGQQTIIDMNLFVLCDDLASVYLDGNFVDSTLSGYRFYQSTIDTFTYSHTLAAGTHTLDVRLYNVGGIAMGLDLTGFITSIDSLVTDTCCNTHGCCCGALFHDHNNDGIQEKGTGAQPIDQGLPGWKIALSSGGNTYNMNTDVFGNYSFENLNTGSYTLTASTPTGTLMKTYNVTIGKQAVTLQNIPISSALLGINAIDAEQSYFHVYPNPATNMLQMDYYIAQSTAISLKVENIEGQKVMQVIENENKSAGKYRQTINIDQLPAGIYFYELTTDRVYQGKFVKQ